MRRSIIHPACCLLAAALSPATLPACAKPEPVMWSIENDFDAMRWVDTLGGTVMPMVFASLDRDEERMVQHPSALSLDLCGLEVYGEIVSDGGWRRVPYALFPGERVDVETRSFMYYRKTTPFGDCAARHTGEMFAQVCQATEAMDSDGERLAPPSGDEPLLADSASSLVDGSCTRLLVPTEEGAVVLLSDGE